PPVSPTRSPLTTDGPRIPPRFGKTSSVNNIRLWYNPSVHLTYHKGSIVTIPFPPPPSSAYLALNVTSIGNLYNSISSLIQGRQGTETFFFPWAQDTTAWPDPQAVSKLLVYDTDV